MILSDARGAPGRGASRQRRLWRLQRCDAEPWEFVLGDRRRTQEINWSVADESVGGCNLSKCLVKGDVQVGRGVCVPGLAAFWKRKSGRSRVISRPA